jgi:hypothetical protein
MTAIRPERYYLIIFKNAPSVTDLSTISFTSVLKVTGAAAATRLVAVSYDCIFELRLGPLLHIGILL